ncbi:MAG TPA: DUF4148 domain-containing protein [Paraburkholderia sp.]|jgi:hypothetical protein
MRIPTRIAASALLLLCTTASAFASGPNPAPLTHQQCTDYPFVTLKHPATHAQLMNELSELESVGYDPSGGEDNTYPGRLQTAEQRLQAKYAADCMATESQSTAQNATSPNATD